MFENYQICPYTGLRSFSEEESLYFKGREDDIEQATSQLQKNKFLMLTGASGDGKSSLVYAGIIPNARAGFLKSKYTNWCIAGFRPERTPFQNLAGSLAKQLDIPNPYTVQGELNHGFSALVDLYKNSKRFIDIHSDAWLRADEKEKGRMKREAANLIILVDQFEELFTNPENYHQGVPSRDANLVLNLLLETARIALEEDIPIYVIFTMRSDYIGQCAAFRGLPEYIGFSQFFVPRLNRSQLQQVIEEPATLSGNRIARRLTERLIHDLTEGVDQLPILQHALKQIWIAADSGNEEMDLIHYAMVGGMPVTELPDEQVNRFNDWFALLSPEIKACYHAPNLQNVLDTHTNKLYEQAAGYYLSNTGKPISDLDAKMIIRTAFTCLTKIDQSRAVRNRMTLQEITNLLGNPEFDHTSVGALLNIFREPGNTFINPFISDEDPDSRQLNPGTVLDITHESLIRNWQWLGQWAKEEYDSYSVSLDFEKQLDRWVNSGKSNNYLLSIGPLTYFENWYNKAKPNAWWIARYLPEETNNETKLDNAVVILNHSREFIKKSATKHVVTRTVMRYGPKRIAAVIGIVALLVLSSFTIRNYFQKQNVYVLDNIFRQSLKLSADPRVAKLSKSVMAIETLKEGGITLDGIIQSIPDSVQKINVINGIASMLIFQGRDEPADDIARSLFLTDSLMESIHFSANNPAQIASVLKEINLFRIALEMAYFYRPDAKNEALRQRNADRSARWAKRILEEQPAGFQDIQNLNLALENAINYHSFTNDELSQLVKKLSPFENGLQTEWLKSNFQKDKLLLRGSESQNYGFKYNGLYQELAYLYAALGEGEKGIRCLDSLLANSQNNFQGDYANGGDNAANIAAVFFSYDKSGALDAFVKGYCTRKKTTEEDFYNRLIARTIHNYDASNNLRIYPFMDETLNVNLKLCSRKQLSAFFEKYRETVQATIHDPDQKNYLLALSYKNEGILKSINKENPSEGDPDTNGYFERALALYQSVNPDYLNASISITVDATDVKLVGRKYMFVYPDIVTPFHPSEPRSYFVFYVSDVFMNFIISKKLLNSFYPGNEEIGYLNQWLESNNITRINPQAFMVFGTRNQVFKDIEESFHTRDTSNIDFNRLYIYLGKEAQDSGKLDEMSGYYDKIDSSKIFNMLREKDFFGFVRDQSFRMIGFAVEGYMKAGNPARAYRLVNQFKNPSNRSSLYAFAAVSLLKEKGDDKLIRPLIDSALAEMDRKENRTNNQPNRGLLAYALAMENPSENTPKAYTLIRNLGTKFEAIRDISRGVAFRNELYGAVKNIPANISSSDEADFIWAILLGYSEGKTETRNEWKKYIQGYPARLKMNIVYVDESN